MPADPPPPGLDTRYHVTALADPHVVLRLLNLLAQRDLIADAIAMRRDGELLTLDLRVAALPPDTARLIAEKMRALVPVVAVDWQSGPCRPALPMAKTPEPAGQRRD